MPGVTAAARGRAVVLAYNGVPALTRSDFTIPTGALTAVIGPNGSGKSTLLNALTGLVQPIAGSIEVFGLAVDRAHDRVAYVLQSTKVNEVMPVTVREVVAMGRYARRGRFSRAQRAADRAARDAAIDSVAIADLAGHQLGELSGGQRQRVFVAQGLAQQADLLLLDEPVTGLDLVSRTRIVSAMRGELAAGRTVAYTTHDLAEAAEADHVILTAGKVVAEGIAADVLAPDVLAAAYGVGIVHLEDGSIVLDDAAHRPAGPHVHFERGDSRS